MQKARKRRLATRVIPDIAIVTSLWILSRQCQKCDALCTTIAENKCHVRRKIPPLHAVANVEQESDTETSALVHVPSMDASTCRALSLFRPRHTDPTRPEAEKDLDRLKDRLAGIGLLKKDHQKIIAAIRKASDQNHSLMVEIIDFIQLVVALREMDNEFIRFVTAPVLHACILQYCAEQPKFPREATKNNKQTFLLETQTMKLSAESLTFFPTARPLASYDVDRAMISDSLDVDSRTSTSLIRPTRDLDPPKESKRIAQGALKIRGAELLVQAILSRDMSSSNALKVRELLLSVMEDWRSLAIRVAVFLFQLERMAAAMEGTTGEFLERPPEAIFAAKTALRVYATLAERLGMGILKARIENAAFRILYRRQYEVVSHLYRQDGNTMKRLSAYILSHISQTLRRDESLMEHLEDIEITSRLKQPYSFWRKLLKQRIKHSAQEAASGSLRPRRSSLSLNQVPDTVGLRVILKCREIKGSEQEEELRAREQILCYYVQQKLRRMFPGTESRVKDYIAKPKANNYQSLHTTFQFDEYFFEVQIRSSEMHKQAEFGSSSHWVYKLGFATEEHVHLPGSKSYTSAPSEDNIETGEIVPHPANARGSATSSHIESLLVAQRSLVEQKVYVFILGGDGYQSGGELVSVPVDCSIADMVENIESTVPSKVQVWRHGRLATVHHNSTFESGDVVMIAL